MMLKRQNTFIVACISAHAHTHTHNVVFDITQAGVSRESKVAIVA